jgi:HD-GYP domain-containing protein (c-di-GMP phosphodiesterase class II)
VRLHAYQTERVLAVSSTLAPYGRLGGMHHERMDSSGYHRGLPAMLLPLPARILAAADAFVAMTEPRAHRPALAPEQAAKELRAGVGSGLFDAGAVNAICESAGQTGVKARAPNPAGLTEREVQILQLLARGGSKKQIAAQLFISPGTVLRM